jgi:hypothetical protein
MSTTPQPPSPEQLARILGTKFYAARHPVEFEAALAEITAIIRRNQELEKFNLVEYGKRLEGERDALKRENEELKQANAELNNECQNHVEHMKSFREKAEALDWLVSQKTLPSVHCGDFHYWGNSDSRESLLSAINSARKEQSK